MTRSRQGSRRARASRRLPGALGGPTEGIDRSTPKHHEGEPIQASMRRHDSANLPHAPHHMATCTPSWKFCHASLSGARTAVSKGPQWRSPRPTHEPTATDLPATAQGDSSSSFSRFRLGRCKRSQRRARPSEPASANRDRGRRPTS